MKYLNALNKISGVGPQKFKLLLNFFGSGENIWNAGASDLLAAKIGPALTEKIIAERKDIDPDAEWQKLQKEKIEMLTLDDPRYPRLLKEINNPPYIIYIKGETSWDWNVAPMVSIVGSRKYTAYGAQAAQTLARDLANAGVTIVSGMALGIDAFAHRGSLEAGGKTIAVLGGGLDDKSIGPRANYNLAQEIVENGVLLSDCPIGTQISEFNFPARNRLIAGLSAGTLVVEAGEKSGSLITSDLALEYNREVFAIPGPIFSSQSIGTNQLIKKGAKIVASVADILEELNLTERETSSSYVPKVPETVEEKILLQILGNDPLHIDNIAKLSKLGTVPAASALSIMEIKGWVKNIGGQNYIIL